MQREYLFGIMVVCQNEQCPSMLAISDVTLNNAGLFHRGCCSSEVLEEVRVVL